MKKNRSKTLIYRLMLFLLPASVSNAKAIYSKETIYIPSPVTMHILSFEKNDFFISVHTVEEPYVKELSSIVESSGALFGLNGGFFGRENNEILGLLSSNGKIISKKRLFGRGSLIVGNDNSIRIDMLSREDLTGEIALEERFILSGGHIILCDSKVPVLKSKKNPMTAVGYNADRIYLVVAEGRNLTSWGIDEKRLGAYMREIGCTHAIAMDGGGSSELCFHSGAADEIRCSDNLFSRNSDRPVIVNDTSDGGERPIKTAILFFKNNFLFNPGEDLPDRIVNNVIAKLNRHSFHISKAGGTSDIFNVQHAQKEAVYSCKYSSGKNETEDVMVLFGKKGKNYVPKLTFFPVQSGEPLIEITDGLEYYSIVSKNSNIYFFNLPKEELLRRDKLCELLIFHTVSDIINSSKE